MHKYTGRPGYSTYCYAELKTVTQIQWRKLLIITHMDTIMLWSWQSHCTVNLACVMTADSTSANHRNSDQTNYQVTCTVSRWHQITLNHTCTSKQLLSTSKYRRNTVRGNAPMGVKRQRLWLWGQGSLQCWNIFSKQFFACKLNVF